MQQLCLEELKQLVRTTALYHENSWNDAAGRYRLSFREAAYEACKFHRLSTTFGDLVALMLASNVYNDIMSWAE